MQKEQSNQSSPSSICNVNMAKYSNKGLDSLYRGEYWTHVIDDSRLESLVQTSIPCPTINPPNSVLLGASDRLALSGIRFVGNEMKLCDIVLREDINISPAPPLQQQQTVDVKTSSEIQAGLFTQYCQGLGLGVSLSIENSGIRTVTEHASTTEYFYRGFHTVVPTARYVLHKPSLRLSKGVINELKKVLALTLNDSDLVVIQASCEGIFERFGSHVCVGDVHLGGIYTWESRYEGRESDVAHLAAVIDRSLQSGVVGSPFEARDVSFGTSRRGGPQDATSFDLWKLGLESDRKSWSVIDRGDELVGIWDILENHCSEFTHASNLAKTLRFAFGRKNQSPSEGESYPSVINPVVEHNDSPDSGQRSPIFREDHNGRPTPERDEPPQEAANDANSSSYHEEINQESAIEDNIDDMPWDEPEQSEVEKADLLKRLELEEYYPAKITLDKVMGVVSTTGRKERRAQVVWDILEKLIMLDQRAYSSEVHRLAQPDDTREREEEPRFSDIPDFVGNATDLNPLDVIHTIFLCCDLKLRQVLVQKMLLCRLAFPFLSPGIFDEGLTYNLWAMRASILEWRDRADKAQESSAVDCPVHVVSCLRVNLPNISKSKLLNSIICEETQDTFFNVDCTNGEANKVSSPGLVEGSFSLPSGKENNRNKDVTLFLNLRGDATKHRQQVELFSQISNVSIVCVDIADLADRDVVATMSDLFKHGCKLVMVMSNKQGLLKQRLQKILQTFSSKISSQARQVKRIFTFVGGQQKNVSQLKKDVQEAIDESLLQQRGLVLKDLVQIMQHERVLIDENRSECQEAKAFADTVIARIKEIGPNVNKSTVLPLQGKTWYECCRLLKDKKRTHQTGAEADHMLEVGKMEQQMKEQRQEQDRLITNLTPVMASFLKGLMRTIDTPKVDFYMEWLKLHLDEFSRKVLPPLQEEYRQKMIRMNKAKKADRYDPALQRKLQEEIKQCGSKIENAAFGMEHFIREMGQIYEASIESGNTEHIQCFNSLPQLAAKLLRRGHSLEILDGDASGVPLVWLKAVFNELELMLGKQKLFCLSVLGIQSSGKSTLLNTMFGLQFPVSAGRCTRGVYMQLVKVKEDSNLPFNYVAVIDSEGLRAPEIGDRKYDHDNELATFVIGLGNLTMMNLKGENVTEVKDILQIVTHAFLRMMMVNENIQKDRSCVFVHQNVAAINAPEKMMIGAQKFEEALDKMTADAAALEKKADIHSFNQVIKFDNQKHIWYFPDLWQGIPPMAAVNTGYHESALKLKSSILDCQMSDSQWFYSFSDMTKFIKDMWYGVLADDFVFGFRNSLVTQAYNHLEYKYSQLKWNLQTAYCDWLNKTRIRLEVASTLELLHSQYVGMVSESVPFIRAKQEEIVSELNKFIDTNSQKEFMISWQKDKALALQCAADSLCLLAKGDIERIHAEQGVKLLKNNKQDHHKKELLRKAERLAEAVKDETDEKVLTVEFDTLWNDWISNIAIHEQTADDMSIKDQLVILLYELCPDQFNALVHELEKNPMDRAPRKDCLEGSLTNFRHEDLSLTMWNRVWSMIKTTELERLKTSAIAVLDNIFRSIDSYLRQVSKGSDRFKSHDAKEVLMIVKTQLRHFNNEPHQPFMFPSNFEVRLLVHVAKHSLAVFEDVQNHYERLYSITAQLQEYKRTTWNLFHNLVNQTGKEVTLIDMMCDLLEPLLVKHIKKELKLAVVAEVVPHFVTKQKLIKAILRDLAVKERFDLYKGYVSRTKSFTLDWLTQYTDKYIFTNTSWYMNKTTASMDRLMTALEQSIQSACSMSYSQKTFADWVRNFSLALSKTVAFAPTNLPHFVDDQVDDFISIQKTFGRHLKTLKDNVLSCFQRDTSETIKWDYETPYTQICNSLWGCEALCPFCHEPCVKSDAQHASLTDNHRCVQHRPQGIGFWRWSDTQKLCVESCSYHVQHETLQFYCHGLDHPCDKDADVDPARARHPFKEYKKYFPKWEIPPSADMDSCDYWKWYFSTFKAEMAKAGSAKEPDIPESWYNVTKGRAIESLFVYD